MSFDNNSFVAGSNFTRVKFSDDKPVLETELNELQSILRDYPKRTIKALFGNGVLGRGSYTYSGSTFTLTNELALVEGELIEIDNLTLAVSEGETIYLQTWLEEVTHGTSIKKFGNKQSATTVVNNIKDARFNTETSRREQLVYNLSKTTDTLKNNVKLGVIKNGVFEISSNVVDTKVFEVNQKGSYITAENSTAGSLTNVEVLGNTVQNSSNLADIKSVGIIREDGNYEIGLTSCSKNLDLGIELEGKYYSYENGAVATNSVVNSHKARVKANTKYTPTNAHSNITFWTMDNKFISGLALIQPFTTPANCGYVRYAVETSKSSMVQLEEGTVATSYEPYQGTTSKINLPCQLEKVGDISDRLFRREDGVWCIEKNIGEVVFDGSNDETWSRSGSGTYFGNTSNGHYINVTDIKTIISTSEITTISNTLPSVSSQYGSIDGNVGIFTSNGNNRIYIRTFNSITSSLETFKTWLSQNPTTVKYQLDTPQIIELPLDVQISLNSFFGTTNVFIESGEVDGTIKCTIPKSLGASLQSLISKADSIEERVGKIENLQKGNEMQVSTNKKSVVIEDTNEGYVTEFNIKGDTLVNLLDGVTNVSSSNIHCIIRDKSLFSGDKKYTIINLNTKPITVGFYKYSDFTYNFQQIIQGNSCIVVQDTLNYPRNILGNFSDGWTSSDKLNVLILEGDHTDKDISYFEGLKSVGDGVDKITFISTFNSPFTYEKGSLYTATGLPFDHETNGRTDFIKCNVPFIDKNIQCRIYEYDENKNFIKCSEFDTLRHYINKNTYYVRVIAPLTDLIKFKMCCKGSNKELLYKNAEGIYEKPVLRKVSDTIYDSIELHSDGKYYYHKRCNEVVLNGSENSWSLDTGSSSTEIGRFGFNNVGMLGNRSNLVSDKYNMKTDYTLASNNVEGIFTSVNGSTLFLDTLYSRLSSQTLEGFKLWLQQNPVKVVYTLATEEIYECINIDLNSYDDITFISLESGFINPQFSAKVSKHIGNVVNQIKEKTDNLEERVAKIIDERTKGYNSDKGYIIAEDTTDSYIGNIKIEGNTLVNILPKGFNSYTNKTHSTVLVTNNKLTMTGTGTYPSLLYDVSLFKPNTLYTLILNVKTLNVLNTGQDWCVFRVGEGDTKVNVTVPNPTTTGLYVVTFTTPNVTKILDAQTFFRPVLTSSHSVELEGLVILEGDHTNNPPSYFEGLLSTGQDVEVMKLETQNRNYMDLSYGFTDSNNTYVSHQVVYDRLIVKATNSLGNGYVRYNIPSDNLVEGETYTYMAYTDDVTTDNVYLQVVDGNGLHYTSARNTPITFIKKGDMQIRLYSNLGASVTRTREYYNIGIYVGDKLPTFEPHTTTTKQLLYKNSEGEFIPVPALRGVNGSVKDTIELHSDGKYYYHKRLEEIILDGDEVYDPSGLNSSLTDFKVFIHKPQVSPYIEVSTNISKILCDKFNPLPPLNTSSASSVTKEGVSCHNIYGELRFVIASTKLTTQDTTGFKTWLSENPITLVYQLATEEVYECNYLDLNSYGGETLVQIDSGVISPSKLSFTTNSDLPNLVERMKEDVDKNTKFREEMTESVTLTREFDKGYGIFEDTREGSVAINKIEGNTLVNLVEGTSKSIQVSASTLAKYNHKQTFKPNTLYTCIINIKNLVLGTSPYVFISHNSGDSPHQSLSTNGTYIYTFTTPSDATRYSSTWIYFKFDATGCSGIVDNITLLEGDHTQNPPSYFEGLKSVGDLETLEVQSRKEDGNLLNKNTVIQDSYIVYNTGVVQGGNTTYCASDFIPVEPNTQYYKTDYLAHYCFYDRNKNPIPISANNATNTFTTPFNAYYVRITVVKANMDISKLIKGSKDTNVYNHYKGNKKEIYVKNSSGIYEKPILRSTGIVSDTIELHSDGKYYYHKRCEKIVLNGSEIWAEGINTSSTTKWFYTPYLNGLGNSLKVQWVADKVECDYSSNVLARYNKGENFTALSFNSANNFEFVVSQSKLTTQNISGFTTWLASNPVTVVCQLVKEEVYECVNLDLDSYEGETSILLPSTIPAKVKASVGSNLLATIESLKGRIEYLETEFSDMTENGSGWCKLPNGMIMQWGEVFYKDLVQNQWVDKTVNYPIAFKQCVSCMVGTSGRDRGANREFYVIKVSSDIISPSSCTISLKTGTASTWGGAEFIAIGYI